MIEVRDHNFILKQPFLNFIKFSWEYIPDGIFNTIIYLHMYQIRIFCALAPKNLTNQRENQIFPQSLNLLDGIYRF